MNSLLDSIILLTTAITLVFGQYRYYPEKPGSCPPALPIGICTRSCLADSHCVGAGKCCPTSCGGYVCSRPVTYRPPLRKEKPGTCPATPTGRWVCSSTCTDDSDCRGTKKCCKNRCGALACQNPDIEVIESIEIPYNDNPYGDPYGGIGDNPFLINRNPYLNFN